MKMFLERQSQRREKLSYKENKEEMQIARGTIIKVSLKRKNSSKKDVDENFAVRVTAIMDKHYNK